MAGVIKRAQRQFFSFLSSKHGLCLTLLGAALWVITLVFFGEKAWELRLMKLRYSQYVGKHFDNIAGRSFEEQLVGVLPIDLVYTWVNGSDPKLVEDLKKFKRQLAIELGEDPEKYDQEHRSNATNYTNPADDLFAASRFSDKEELRYSLRSVERFAPWVRHIYIVTNGQIPSWLNLQHPRLTVITHADIFTNQSHLPTFSSPSIETHLHRIPGLSRRFLYLNDDVFFTSEVWPEDFYTYSRGQKIYLAHGIPPCSPGCPTQWLGDGYCDLACNTAACDRDAGDCKNQTTNGSGGSSFSTWVGGAGSETCSPGCPVTWLADRYCDAACNNEACAMDGGDCGAATLEKNVFGFNVTMAMVQKDEPIVIKPPRGRNSLYVNLTEVLVAENSTVVKAEHDNPRALRTGVMYQFHRVMVFVLRPNATCQSVHVTLQYAKKPVPGAQLQPSTLKLKIMVQTANQTVTTPDEPDKYGTKAEAEDLMCEGLEEDPFVKRENITARIQEFKTFQTLSAQGASGSGNYNWSASWSASWGGSIVQIPVVCNGTVLPQNVTAALEALDHELQEGEVTHKGYRKRKAALLLPYSLNCTNTTNTTNTTTSTNTTETPAAAALESQKQGTPPPPPPRPPPQLPEKEQGKDVVGAVEKGKEQEKKEDILVKKDQEKASSDGKGEGEAVGGSSKKEAGEVVSGGNVVEERKVEDMKMVAGELSGEAEEQFEAQQAAMVVGKEEEANVNNEQQKQNEGRNQAGGPGRKLQSVDMNQERIEINGDVIGKEVTRERREVDVNEVEIAPRGDLVGWLPWEKRGTFRREINRLEGREQYGWVAREVGTGRQLMDKFADSLRHVNKLYTQKYGKAERKIIAHMPHMIDRDIMAALQHEFADEFEQTSSHRIRHSKDMQYAFSYMYFLMSQPPPVDLEKLWERTDTDQSDTLSDIEVRVLATYLYDLPIKEQQLADLYHGLIDCAHNIPPHDPNDTEKLHAGKESATITREIFTNCTIVADQAQNTTKKMKFYRYELVGDDSDVIFHLIRNNVTIVRDQLDQVLKRRPKFACLNDDIDHHLPDAQEVEKLLKQLYETLFPFPSAFELPDGSRNRFLDVDSLRAWQGQYETVQRAVNLVFLLVAVAIVVNYVRVCRCARADPLTLPRAIRTSKQN